MRTPFLWNAPTGHRAAVAAPELDRPHGAVRADARARAFAEVRPVCEEV
jgi:hypothetical protein